MLDDPEIESSAESETAEYIEEAPLTPPSEPIDPRYIYAVYDFLATDHSHVTIHKNDELVLLNDADAYWWLVKVMHTDEIGFVPAEAVEIYGERLARLNKFKNEMLQQTEVESDNYTEPLHTRPRADPDKSVSFSTITYMDGDADVTDELISPISCESEPPSASSFSSVSLNGFDPSMSPSTMLVASKFQKLEASMQDMFAQTEPDAAGMSGIVSETESAGSQRSSYDDEEPLLTAQSSLVTQSDMVVDTASPRDSKSDLKSVSELDEVSNLKDLSIDSNFSSKTSLKQDSEPGEQPNYNHGTIHLKEVQILKSDPHTDEISRNPDPLSDTSSPLLHPEIYNIYESSFKRLQKLQERLACTLDR